MDTATGEQLRAILHHPAFQALEAAWRSVHDFVMAVDSTEICIELLDVTRQELLDDSGAAAGEPPATQLRALLEERGAGMDDGPLWSLLIGDYQFGATAEDVALLGALGTLAARAGGPFLAAALPETLGASSPAALADPTSWPALPEDHQRHWNRLRTSAVAPWLGLVLPRVLLRLPYGSKTDPIESFPFEEMPAGHDPAAYLWGNPAFICARLIAAEFGESGWQEGLGAMTELDDLPGHAYEDSGSGCCNPPPKSCWASGRCTPYWRAASCRWRATASAAWYGCLDFSRWPIRRRLWRDLGRLFHEREFAGKTGSGR